MNRQIETKRRAIGYCRVSTALQEAEGYSLEAQQKAIEEYCAKAGYELLDTYTEQASGSKNDREVVNTVIKRCRSTKSKLVIARLDRFTRDLHFLTSLQRQKFDFIALDNPSADSMVIQIMMSVAENESRMISTRTRTALRIAKENGVELGNHRSILATYSKLEQDKKLGLTRYDDNLWDTFCMYRTAWHDYVVNHKKYKLFRKYIDPMYEVVDTGYGWEEYIRRPNPYAGDEDEFWDNYQRDTVPEDLIGDRYKNGTWNLIAFGDMCEDAFLMNPLESVTAEWDYGVGMGDSDRWRMMSNAFHLPCLDMKKNNRKIDTTINSEWQGQKYTEEMNARAYIPRYKHKAEITLKHSDFNGIGKGEVKIRAYDIGRLWKQLLRDSTKLATLSRVQTARQEALDIYIPALQQARSEGITGIRPLARYLTEQGIITPKGNETWSPSSIQSILKIEEAINTDAKSESDTGESDDLATALVFNGYCRGAKGHYRNEEDGHITDGETPHFDNPRSRS